MEINQRGDYGRSAVTVSVIIPVYNCVEYTPAALDSVFAQTFTDFEIILVNDGSPDTQILEYLISPYKDRIVYLKQTNRGPSAARNTGIRAARGKYLAFLDGDDRWPSEYLAAQMSLFEQKPSLDLVYTDAVHFGDTRLPRKTFMQSLSPPMNFEDLLAAGSQIIPSATVVSKRVVIDAGLFDESLRGPEDYDLCLRITYRGAQIGFQSRVLALRRVHSKSLTADDMRMLEGLERVLTKWDKSQRLSQKTRSLLLSRLASIRTYVYSEKGKRHLLSGNLDQARDYLLGAYTSLCQTNSQPTVRHRTNPVLLRTAKLRVLLSGLRTVPRLTVFGAQMWENFLWAAKFPHARTNM